MESGLTAGLPALRCRASFFACRQPPFSGRGAAAVASPLVSIATSAYLPLTLVPNCLITYPSTPPHNPPTSASELLESRVHGELCLSSHGSGLSEYYLNEQK